MRLLQSDGICVRPSVSDCYVVGSVALMHAAVSEGGGQYGDEREQGAPRP